MPWRRRNVQSRPGRVITLTDCDTIYTRNISLSLSLSLSLFLSLSTWHTGHEQRKGGVPVCLVLTRVLTGTAVCVCVSWCSHTTMDAAGGRVWRGNNTTVTNTFTDSHRTALHHTLHSSPAHGRSLPLYNLAALHLASRVTNTSIFPRSGKGVNYWWPHWPGGWREQGGACQTKGNEAVWQRCIPCRLDTIDTAFNHIL